MRRKTPVAVVAGHELLPTDRGVAGPAGSAVPAWDYSRNYYIATFPICGAFARCHDAPRDFVSESEWERGARGYTVESEADIGVSDAAAGNLYYHLVGPRLKSEKFVPLQTLSRSSQTVTVAASRG